MNTSIWYLLLLIVVAYLLLSPQSAKTIKLSRRGKKNLIVILIVSFVLYYTCFYTRELFGEENEDERLLAQWAPSVVKIENDEPVY